MAGSIRVAGHTIAEHDIVNDKVDVKNATLDSSVTFPSFVGMIASFAMSSAPSGWLVCNGAEYAIADYGDLHTAIGTTWGALTNGSGGAGSTHFVVPDLQGAFLRGSGTGTINSRNKAGGSVGGFQEDSYQGFKSQLRASGGDITIQNVNSGGQVTGKIPYGTASGGSARTVTIDHIDNGSNGVPRESSETKPYNASVQYCIKY